ncbi:hypothetical protein PQ455_07075 [Sphingomonas naphthae]|uniref:Uncharacterized protein n=1 Tax=Sphingomonas naphthae TaxID=1813468 RepID=A0ABY7TP13_9SPHN|nr:hypothetical protein [Sphingomonas naphthae]WCT74974.1 hypothetical protein PQ455_07075 [Sphingomonas naphthae]
MDANTNRIALESLPDLATPVGVAGQMRHVEVGGDACFGIIIAIAVFQADNGE